MPSTETKAQRDARNFLRTVPDNPNAALQRWLTEHGYSTAPGTVYDTRTESVRRQALVLPTGGGHGGDISGNGHGGNAGTVTRPARAPRPPTVNTPAPAPAVVGTTPATTGTAPAGTPATAPAPAAAVATKLPVLLALGAAIGALLTL